MKGLKEKGSVYCRGKINHAGIHLLIEMWKAKNISSTENAKQVLSDAVKACGATLLDIHAHIFDKKCLSIGYILLRLGKSLVLEVLVARASCSTPDPTTSRP